MDLIKSNLAVDDLEEIGIAKVSSFWKLFTEVEH